MNPECSGTASPFSTTPPSQIVLPPTPPGTVERQSSSTVASVDDLKRHWKESALRSGTEPDKIINLKTSNKFKPHDYLDDIESWFRQFDCHCASIRLRMPSLVHEHLIAGVEREYTIKQFQHGGQFSSINLGRSSRIFLDGRKESRQPDIQFRYGSTPFPGIVIEVAYTQQEKELHVLAHDYILKSDGAIRRVYGIVLNPLGEVSTILEWCAKVTPSKDPDFDEEVRVEMISRKVQTRHFFSIAQEHKTLTCEQVFRATDGSCTNPDECIAIPLMDFGVDTDGLDERITISFQTIFDCYNKALQTQALCDMEREERPRKRVKRIDRTPSPMDELRPDDEAKVRAAEEATERSSHQSDFEPSTDGELASDSSDR